MLNKSQDQKVNQTHDVNFDHSQKTKSMDVPDKQLYKSEELKSEKRQKENADKSAEKKSPIKSDKSSDKATPIKSDKQSLKSDLQQTYTKLAESHIYKEKQESRS